MSEREIAKVEAAFLGWEDHGILTARLAMSYGHAGQSVGGYALDRPAKVNGKFVGRFGTAYGMEFVARLMKACGVDEWSKLVGRTVYVVQESGNRNRVLGIEPLPTEGGEPFLFAEIAGYTEPKVLEP